MNFERAEYVQQEPIEGEVVGRPAGITAAAAFPLALVYGAMAALLGSIGYALIWSLGFMVSIVAIGIGWLIAKAMMTASHGIGGRPYQFAAIALTYLAVSCGEVMKPVWVALHHGAPLRLLLSPVILKYALFGPLLGLQEGLNAILGIIILGVGMRAAWRLAAGSPGFGAGPGAGSGPRMTPFGPR